MSREIKFRAWLDYGNGVGEMLPNIQNHINGEWAFGHIVNGNVENISEPMQCTGLKDVNGVEIYEGDIVNIAGCGDYEVEFPFIELYEASDDGCEMRIVGNVFEGREYQFNCTIISLSDSIPATFDESGFSELEFTTIGEATSKGEDE